MVRGLFLVLLLTKAVGWSQGVGNQNLGNYTFIGSGATNQVTVGVSYGFIGAGGFNTNSANNGFIGAGIFNKIPSSGRRAFIGAGSLNAVGGQGSAIVVGENNLVDTNSSNSIIGAGQVNRIQSNSPASFMGAGNSNTIWPNCPGSLIAGGDQNSIYNGGFVMRSNSVIVGGYRNFLGESFYSSIAGGYLNTNRNSDYTFMGGGAQNCITNACAFALIGGGWNNWIINESDFSVIAGGKNNTINLADHATISGGWLNEVAVSNGTVGGGFTNTVSGGFGTIGGGASNTVGGLYATIPGGSENIASGNWSTAIGFRARATNFGSFVVGLGPVAVSSSSNSQVTILAPGGTRIFSSIGVNAGVVLNNNATAWSVLSDRNSKENFRSIQPKLVLARLVQMPVTEWNYKHDPSRRYIGPTAQDFQASFGLGDATTINTLDADGVALAAIQGLVEELQERDRTMAWEKLQSASALAERDAEIEELQKGLHELKARLDSLSPPANR